MRRCLFALPLAAALLLAACGGHTTITTATTTKTVAPSASSPKAPTPAIQQPAAGCPPGQSFMGCSQAPHNLPRLATGGRPPGKLFPDVSSWQGQPNWGQAKPFITAAAAKLGEYTVDPDAAYNIAAFKRLGIPYVVYWFVRPTGCAHEGALIERYAKAYGVHTMVVFDEEAPGIAGYAQCLAPYAQRATGVTPSVYRSSGNNFDSSASSLACWVAAYGPSSTPPCDGRKVTAWQFTDGRYGFPVYIPGVGQGDVSVDLGLFAKPSPPKPADPFAKAPNTVRYFGTPPHRDHAREHNTLVTGKRLDCHLGNPHRATCKSTRRHALLLEGRIWTVATNHGKLKNGHRRWGRDNLGIRYRYLANALARR